MHDDDVRNGGHDLPNGVPANGRRPDGVLTPAFTRVLTDDENGEGRDDDGAPLDLVAVQVDDQLVTAIGARATGSAVAGPPRLAGLGAAPAFADEPEPHSTDDRLAGMLAAWRAEIDAEPIPELVDLDAAVAAVLAGVEAHTESTTLAARRRRAGRLRQLAPLAAAAAIIVATVTGVGLGSQDAMPGDTLWAVQKVVNPERAQSVEAKVAVEGHLEKVRTALQTGDTTTAQRELQAVDTEISSVRGQDGQPQLAQEQEFLNAKLADTPPGTPADLSTPAKSNPAARSTSSPAAPPAPAVAPSTSEAPASPSAGPPPSTDPDARRSARDRPSQAVVPQRPGPAGPVAPAPDVTEPKVTSPPEAPKPAPPPAPESSVPGKTEGSPDPRVAPAPVDPRVAPAPPADQPAPSTQPGASGSDDTPTKTTTASGSAGADVPTAATETTS